MATLEDLFDEAQCCAARGLASRTTSARRWLEAATLHEEAYASAPIERA